MKINTTRKRPLWTVAPKHKKEVIATDRGWVVKETGEVLRSMRNLDTKLKQYGFDQKETPKKTTNKKAVAKKSSAKETEKSTSKKTNNKTTKKESQKNGSN